MSKAVLITVLFSLVGLSFCCNKYCGDGYCERTTHPDPKYQEVCRCRDGNYQFETCNNRQSAQGCGCVNNAICIGFNVQNFWCQFANGASFCCVCFPGWSGSRCERRVSACQSSPCKNGGTCHDANNNNGYTCQCPVGWTGANCETQVLVRKCDARPCGGYQCLEAPNFGQGYICQCGPFDFRTTNCDNKISQGCAETKCLNGICRSNGMGQNYCDCMPGYAGDRCELQYFRCNQNGRFTDIIGCAKGRYFECAYLGSRDYPQGVICQRECPPGYRYNQKQNLCDYPENVPC